MHAFRTRDIHRFLHNRKEIIENMRYFGIILISLSVVIILIGVITPVNIIICLIVAIFLAAFGTLAILKKRK